LDAETLQERTLFDRPVNASARIPRRCAERLKVNMGGEIRHSRQCKRTSIPMGPHRLEGIAGGALDMAVVNDERRPAEGGSAGDRNCELLRPPLQNLPNAHP